MTYKVDEKALRSFLQGEWNGMDGQERGLYKRALAAFKQTETWPLCGACRALELVEALRDLRNGRPVSVQVQAQVMRYGSAHVAEVEAAQDGLPGIK